MCMGPRNWFQGMNSASLCSLTGRYENPIPPRCLAPIDFLKVPAGHYLPTFTFPQKINDLKIEWLIIPITNQKSSFLTLLLKSIHDLNIRLPAAFCSELISLPRNGSERHSESIFLFFVAKRGIPSCALFRGMVRNGIPRICIYFGSTERNSELCSLPQKSSEQNYGSFLLFLFHGTEFRDVFSSAEEFGTEFRDFLFRGTTGIPSEITICSVYSVFRGIIFFSEIPNPMLN